jgi:RNA polymerase-interacting CarD/CdnL/TRCF family regulator
MRNAGSTALVVCIENDGYGVSLERRKIYVSIPDREAEKQGLRRVVDESGEDYLYPADFFRPIELPQPVKRAVLAA